MGILLEEIAASIRGTGTKARFGRHDHGMASAPGIGMAEAYFAMADAAALLSVKPA